MVAPNVPAAASRTTMTARGKRAVVLRSRRFRFPRRFGWCGHATSNLSVAIASSVIGPPRMPSDNSRVFAPELGDTAKTFCFTIVVMVTSLYGSTLYSVTIPASMWSSMWQWNIHIPGLSGTMSTVSICACISGTTSVRLPLCNTTLPCQCGV